MANTQSLPPTRQNLLLLKKRVKLAKNGHKLLKNKHDSLVKSLMKIIKQTLELRKQFQPEYQKIIDNFNITRITIDNDYLQLLTDNPSIHIKTKKTKNYLMGVSYPSIESETEGDLKSYSLVNTNNYLDQTVDGLQKILPTLFQLAEKENAAYILLAEIEKLKRRINGLEYVIIPRTQAQVKFISSKLEELALQEKVTMIQIKDKIMN